MKSGSPSNGIPRRSVPVTFVDANILFSRVLRLLTDNTKDFPAEWMTRQGIELVHPSAMITRLLTDFPREFREAHYLCVDLSASEDEETVLNQLEKATDPLTAAKVRSFVRL